MSSLRENIKLSLDNNLKKRDDIATSTLRLVLAAIKDGDIEFRTKKKGELMFKRHKIDLNDDFSEDSMWEKLKKKVYGGKKTKKLNRKKRKTKKI